ncbi:Protein-lysine N-methyltransferase EFM5 [Tolypocladium capitatum]|uniref:Protein-lysine N-methyltransferase EFM5 n=1 Tax=Tolypocladium capitatum TaxID=45235 RepID=A0A2K3QGR2_9HYPO|nr:Protein-lysine N-methyltransferase EFM5 [Tolypocladium capitatum]
MADKCDEPMALSAHALAALAEFKAEKDAHQAKFDTLQAEVEAGAPLSMEAFTEDWNESQFWVSRREVPAGLASRSNGSLNEVGADSASPPPLRRRSMLANQLFDGSTRSTAIGVVSTPSVFVALRNILVRACLRLSSSGHVASACSLLTQSLRSSTLQRTRQQSDRPRLVLLEHDERFAVFPEFVFYDFRRPLKLPCGYSTSARLSCPVLRDSSSASGHILCNSGSKPYYASIAELKGSLDRIICDPPFLSEDCQTKSVTALSSHAEPVQLTLLYRLPVALTARWLLQANTPNRVIVCTDERMKDLVTKLYQSLGVRNTTFEPRHATLSNEYCCYANFACPIWTGRPGTA